jgi:Icc-related predicted phosphoesterase
VIFRRNKDRAEDGGGVLRLYYASDIHGTEVLWRKFLNAPKHYKAKVLVMGGDVTGKVVIPLVEDPPGVFTARLFGRNERAEDEAQVDALERRIRGNGMYPYRTSAEEVGRISDLPEEERERWFEGVMLQTFSRWLELADERLADSGVRCFVMPGNDDPTSLEEQLAAARHVEACDERIVTFDGYTMLSLGFSNRTPWNSPRELDEDELYRRIAALAEQVEDVSRCIFNLHVPPYDSGLDTAAELDDDFNMVLLGAEPHMIPVGSTAVREAIEKYQPIAALHGHIHESAGATRIGRTLCVNPGSDYHTGRIAGCLVNLDGEKARHQFVTG